jgi:hypothetical protein
VLPYQRVNAFSKVPAVSRVVVSSYRLVATYFDIKTQVQNFLFFINCFRALNGLNEQESDTINTIFLHNFYITPLIRSEAPSHESHPM